MFKVVPPEGGMKEVSFEQLNKMCGDTLDEIFFSEVFTAVSYTHLTLPTILRV